jgi:molybdenum cofactor biosynthesis enzyme MoaA
MGTFADAMNGEIDLNESNETKLRRIKVHLDAVDQAIFDYIEKGGVSRYKVDTGQTVTEVEVTSLAQLRKSQKELMAWYNELQGLLNGTNIMIHRDARTIGGTM